jgi:hypothetical protein
MARGGGVAGQIKKQLLGELLDVGDTGIEPVTSSVSGKRATAAPIARNRKTGLWGSKNKRADDEIRTRDIHLGKVVLYQLSYVRKYGVRSGRSRANCLKQVSLLGGRYWDRTSDLFRVREARYRCANRPCPSGGYPETMVFTEVGTGFEPVYTALQAAASPLGQPTV